MVTKRILDETNVGRFLEVFNTSYGRIFIQCEYMDDNDKTQELSYTTLSKEDAIEFVKELNDLIGKL